MKPQKPELVRPSSPERPVGNNQQIKESLLKDVDAMRIDQGKKRGGV